MLNQSGVMVASAMTTKSCLVDTKTFFSLPCKISGTGVMLAGGGRKIVKMGTPLYGSLTARDTAFTTMGAVDAEPVGIALHDTDVTGGTGNGTVLIMGLVDVSKLETDVVTALASATPEHIILCK